MTCLLTANIASVKIVDLFGLYMDAGTVVFPVSYIFGDVLTEVYGYRSCRRVIWLGFAANLFLVLILIVTLRLPVAPFWHGQEAYEQLIGFTPRLLAASLVAYLAGEFINSAMVSRLKIKLAGRRLWLRIVGSSVAGQLLDSGIFGALAFAGIIPGPELFKYIAVQWLFKSGYEAVISPLTCWVIRRLKQHEGRDEYDYGVSLNPFRLGS
ncbi:MAG: queuosine precursor transporter [Negativicutes bacterium]|nr:queuosine precursor transporter [Negativicutes bacterium]